MLGVGVFPAAKVGCDTSWPITRAVPAEMLYPHTSWCLLVQVTIVLTELQLLYGADAVPVTRDGR